MECRVLVYDKGNLVESSIKKYSAAKQNGSDPRYAGNFFNKDGQKIGLAKLEMVDFSINRIDVSGLEIKCDSKDTRHISETGWRTLYNACKDLLESAREYGNKQGYPFVEIEGSLCYTRDYEGRPNGKIFKVKARYMDTPKSKHYEKILKNLE